jgi:hypothetical protein
MKKTYDFLIERVQNGKTVFVRHCSKCKCERIYSIKGDAVNAEKRDRKCYRCSNWMNNNPTEEKLKKARKKQSNSMVEYRKTVPPWNKGLTKETSEILKKISDDRVGFKHSDETKQIISVTSKERWDSGFYDKIFKKSPEFKTYQ